MMGTLRCMDISSRTANSDLGELRSYKPEYPTVLKAKTSCTQIQLKGARKRGMSCWYSCE